MSALTEEDFTRRIVWTTQDLSRCWLFFGLSLGIYFGAPLAWPDGIPLSAESLLLLNEGVLLSGLLYATWRRGPTLASFGLRSFAPRLLLVGFGALLLVYVAGLLYAAAMHRFGLEPGTKVLHLWQVMEHKWVFYLVAGVMAPVLEECFFRGYLFAGLYRKLPGYGAVLISSLAFTVIHFDLFKAPLMLMIGALLAWLYRRSGSLWPSIILHSVNNLLALLLLGLSAPPVDGL